MSKTYQRKTIEEKKQEIEELTKGMEEKITKHFISPEKMKEYLDYMAKFHQYSVNNSILIREQFNGAQAVGSFAFWKSKGFSVKKGEKGIKVLVPKVTTYFERVENGEKTITQLKFATKEEKEKIKRNQIDVMQTVFYDIGHVFDVSQTNATAKDLPDIFPNRWLEGNVKNYEAMFKALERIAKNNGVKIVQPYSELGSAKGAYYPLKHEISLNPRNGELQNVKTLAHELAHAVLHTKEKRSNYTPAEKEFQAEMVAYTVSSYFGIDTEEYSLSYLHNWTKGKKLEEQEKLLKEVRETAHDFIETIEEELVKEREKEVMLEHVNTQENEVVDYETWKEKNPQYLKMTKAELLPIVAKAQQQRWEKTGHAKSIEEHEKLCSSYAKERMLGELYSRDIHKNDNENIASVEENKIYWYEMIQRPISIGCQPKGFVDRRDDVGRHGIVAYDRPLTEKELDDYDMRVWNDDTEKKEKTINLKNRQKKRQYQFEMER